MDQKLIEKMRKVMELRDRAGTEGEAQAAAAILQKMLTEHNLSIADLEKKGAKAPDATEQSHDLGKAAFKWKLDLADAIAEHYYCVSLVNHQRKTVRFVGRPDNVESLQMVYAWVIQQIKQIASEERKKHHETTGEHIDPLRWQVNFGEGAVVRLHDRLREEKARMAEEMARNEMGDVVALTLSHTKEANDYLESKYGYRRDGKETRVQREYRERKEAEARQKAEWLARDPEAYYKRYPDEHPDAVEARKKLEAAENEKWWKEYRARQRRNQKRRENYEPRGYSRGKSWYTVEAEEKRDEQADRARRAGRAAADRINLRPFLNGDVPADTDKQIKGKKS